MQYPICRTSSADQLQKRTTFATVNVCLVQFVIIHTFRSIGQYGLSPVIGAGAVSALQETETTIVDGPYPTFETPEIRPTDVAKPDIHASCNILFDTRTATRDFSDFRCNCANDCFLKKMTIGYPHFRQFLQRLRSSDVTSPAQNVMAIETATRECGADCSMSPSRMTTSAANPALKLPVWFSLNAIQAFVAV